jgi:hypothetical protein
MLIEEITQPSHIDKQLIECFKKNEWFPLSLDEGKKDRIPAPPGVAAPPKAEFLICSLFTETFQKNVSGNPAMVAKFAEFKNVKSQNPMQKFGSSDYPIPEGRPLTKYISGLHHAHLAHDLIIFYSMEGRNPTQFKLYGIFGHDQSGTGQPANVNKQRSLSKQMGNQVF